MHRWGLFLGLAVAAWPAKSNADAFDHYTNPLLAKVTKAKIASLVKQVTQAEMVENSRALPAITACFLVVRTNEGRLSKLLVQPARQKIDDKRSLPILHHKYCHPRTGE